MKTNILLLTLALSASTCFVTAQPGDPPPEGQRPPGAEGDPAGPGGPGERRGPQLLPPRVAEQLDLTAEQREQVAKLDAEVKRKMEKILTPEQLQQMKQIRPPLAQGGPGRPNDRMGGQGRGPNAPMGGPNTQGRMGGPGAQGRMGAPGMQGGMAGQRPMLPIIEALDLNHDGIIEAEEIAKASESLKKLDKNDDGKLTPDELRPPRLGGMGGFQGPAGQGRRGGPGGPGGPGGGGFPQRPPEQQ
jgi:Spy/CpxP family protein refolding chaperone